MSYLGNRLTEMTAEYKAYMQSYAQSKYGDSPDAKPDADYENALRIVQGTKYEELLKANPYRRQTEFHDTWFSKAGTAAREELRQNSANYTADILQRYYAEQYQEQQNSEAAKVQRMREAGLNPDLLGTSGASEFSQPEAAETPQMDTAAYGAMATEGIMKPMEMASQFISIAQSALGMVTGFQQLANLRTAQVSTDIANARSVDSYAAEVFFDSVSALDLGRLASMDSALEPEHTSSMDDSINAALVRDGGVPFFEDRVSQARFERTLRRYRRSMRKKSDVYKFLTDYQKQRETVARWSQSEFFDPEDETFLGLQEAFAQYNDKIEWLYRDAQETGLAAEVSGNKYSRSKSIFDKKVLNAQSPGLIGSNLNTAEQLKEMQLGQQKAVEELITKLYKTLEEGSRHGGIKGGFSMFALVMLTFVRSNFLQSMVQSSVTQMMSPAKTPSESAVASAAKRMVDGLDDLNP